MSLSKTEFEIIEGKFHDGLGTFAELTLANEIIRVSGISQPPFNTDYSYNKMVEAIKTLPTSHTSQTTFKKEIDNIKNGARQAVFEIINKLNSNRIVQVHHVYNQFKGAKAGDLLLELEQHLTLPISVKTDKSGKVAVAEGQTSDIGLKWADRYFCVSNEELNEIISVLGFSSLSELKSHYLNVARLVATIIISKLGLEGCKLTDLSCARVTNIGAVKYLFHQLLKYKKGNDGSQIIVIDRSNGTVKWESILDAIDIENLTSDKISFLPSRPRGQRQIGSEFGIKVDGRTVVSFQIKHKRGRARGTEHQYEFGDITTRLRI